MLHLIKPFVYLGPAEFNGSVLSGVIRACLRLIFVLGGALVLTMLTISTPVFHPPAAAIIELQLCALQHPADKRLDQCASKLALAKQQTGDETLDQQISDLPSLHDQVLVDFLTKQDKRLDPRTIKFDLEQGFDHFADSYRIFIVDETRPSDRVLLFKNQRVWTGAPFFQWFEAKGWWPFREVVFEASPYVASAMLLDRLSTGPDSGLSVREQQIAKARLDAVLRAVPSARSAGFIFPRSLSGSVQYFTYIFFFAGCIMILLHWIVNILPNTIVRRKRSFKLSYNDTNLIESTINNAEETNESFIAPSSSAAQPRSQVGPIKNESLESYESAQPPPNSEDPAPTGHDVSEPPSKPSEKNSKLLQAKTKSESITTHEGIEFDLPEPESRSKDLPKGDTPKFYTILPPWGGTTLASTDDYIRQLETIRETVVSSAGWLGAKPVIPLLDLQITGFYAVKASRSGSAVPSFIEIETSALAERLDAHQRMITFILWAIPTLGFIGTVLGIGNALLATVDIQSGVTAVKAWAESRVSVEIGVAFDTTFVALILSFILMLALNYSQYTEDRMLSKEKRDALRNLLRIENIGSDDSMIDFTKEMAKLGAIVAKTDTWLKTAILGIGDKRSEPEVHSHMYRQIAVSPPRAERRYVMKIVAIGILASLIWAALFLQNWTDPQIFDQLRKLILSFLIT